jgi:GNAT superfamily N-acetyltransferase
MNTWQLAAENWSDLCADMGCHRTHVPGAFVHVYDIDRSSTFYNFAVVHDPDTFSIEDVEEAFAGEKVPFAVKIPRLTPYLSIEEHLRERGYSLVPVWNLMTHDTNQGERNPEVRVEDVGFSGLEDWLSISNLARLSEQSRCVRKEMIGSALRASHGYLLLAYFRDKPVGEGFLFMKHGIASIHMMETIPEFRRRHVATTVVLEAADLAREEKARLLWLRTRKGGVGEKVYSRCGFGSFSDLLTYTRTPDLEEVGRTDRQ